MLTSFQPTSCPIWLRLLAAFGLWATLLTAANSEVLDLPRASNGRDYTLYVGLPSSYATSHQRYPVIYVLDGYWDFQLVSSIAGNLSYDQTAPEAIVVGIGYSGAAPDVNKLRQIDLTPGLDPSVDPNGSASGQAAAFLQVITSQIIPFVENRYRVDTDFRVLTGSSYAGLFTVYAVFAQPGLFQGYVAASPALWWNGGYVLQTAQVYSSANTSLPARLYLTWGSDESTAIQSTTQQLYAQLRPLNLSGFTVAARSMQGERHAGPKAESYNRGLRFAFAPRAPVPTATDPGFSSKPVLANLSTRGRVGTGDDVLIAGLVIQGLDPKRVLVRAVGPALTPLGVQNALSDPRFRVVDSHSQTVASNDNWSDKGNGPAITAATSTAGAFTLTSGSKDAAALVTLAPGAYTVVVESSDGSSGIALVEAYELNP